jgi:CHAD domain-containing protein
VKAMEQLSRRGVLEDLRARLQPMAVRDGDVYLYTPTLYQHSFTAINAQLEAFLAYGPIVDQPDKVEELHEMRIVAKKLRYTMETFAPLYGERLKKSLQSVKLAQELLGDIHDCDVWLDYLPAFIEEERQRTIVYLGHDRPMKRIMTGILHFEEDRRQTRNSIYQQYVCYWHDWQEEALWENMRSTIQTPFFQLLAIEKSPQEPPAAE